MAGVIIILLTVAAVAIFISVRSSLSDFYNETDEDDQVISFRSFKSFYEINPSRWVAYKDGSNRVKCIVKSGDIVFFRFRFFDYKRYQTYIKEMNKHKKELKDSADMARVLAAVKKDIEGLETTAEMEIRRGQLTIQTIEEILKDDAMKG